MTFKQAIEYANNLSVKLIPYEMADSMSYTKKIISNIKAGESIGFIIGPEGGIDEKELELALSAGFKQITLGKRILRTETAAMTVMSILMYHLESD